MKNKVVQIIMKLNRNYNNVSQFVAILLLNLIVTHADYNQFSFGTNFSSSGNTDVPGVKNVDTLKGKQGTNNDVNISI